MKGLYVVIEGVCASGKSTAIRNVGALLTFREVPTTADLNMLRRQPRNTAEAGRNDSHYLCVEAIRYRKALELVERNALVLGDRDYLGVTSCSYGYHGLFPVFPDLARTFLARLDAGDLGPPSAYVYIRASNLAIRARLEGQYARNTQVGEAWTTPHVLDRQRRFLEGYFACLPSIPVLTVDADRPCDSIRDDVIRKLTSMRAEPIHPLQRDDFAKAVRSYVHGVLAREFGVAPTPTER